MSARVACEAKSTCRFGAVRVCPMCRAKLCAGHSRDTSRMDSPLNGRERMCGRCGAHMENAAWKGVGQ